MPDMLKKFYKSVSQRAGVILQVQSAVGAKTYGSSVCWH